MEHEPASRLVVVGGQEAAHEIHHEQEVDAHVEGVPVLLLVSGWVQANKIRGGGFSQGASSERELIKGHTHRDVRSSRQREQHHALVRSPLVSFRQDPLVLIETPCLSHMGFPRVGDLCWEEI